MEDGVQATMRWLVPILLSLLGLVACAPPAEAPPLYGVSEGAPPAGVSTQEGVEHIQVPPPPLSDGIFPCSDCHDSSIMEPNTERRELELAHEDIVLEHDAEHRWCLDCHDANDRDKLHLANGTLVPFEESYRLCGQCHGDKYRDWRVGVHGRRIGKWNGQKEYLLCVHCHNAHSPRFKPIEPKPAPHRPQRTP